MKASFQEVIDSENELAIITVLVELGQMVYDHMNVTWIDRKDGIKCGAEYCYEYFKKHHHMKNAFNQLCIIMSAFFRQIRNRDYTALKEQYRLEKL